MTLNDIYSTDSVFITDGAWGTQFQALGLPAGRPPELWNTENRPAVSEVAASYIAAGSQIILSNTFGANRISLQRHGEADRAAELARSGAKISREAVGVKAKVFGSIGPSGKIVMMGELSEQEFTDAFAETAEALATGGADAIVLETFNELAEARLAVQAVKQATNLPVVVSMTFASGPDKTKTLMGESPAHLAEMAQAEGADIIGTNCGRGPDHYTTLVKQLRSASDLPIWIKPNAGMPQPGKNGRTIFPVGPEEFASYVPDLLSAGANFIGGCCGTTPDHIRAIRRSVDKQAR